MRKNGEPVERLSRKARLPSECHDEPEMLIPTNRVFNFRELPARVTGLPGIAQAVTSDLGIAHLGDRESFPLIQREAARAEGEDRKLFDEAIRLLKSSEP